MLNAEQCIIYGVNPFMFCSRRTAPGFHHASLEEELTEKSQNSTKTKSSSPTAYPWLFLPYLYANHLRNLQEKVHSSKIFDVLICDGTLVEL